MSPLSKEQTLLDLSHPQRRAWFSELLYPGTGVGNLAGCVQLSSSSDHLPLLQQAIEQVVGSHDALRLQLSRTSSTLPRQYVVDPPKLTLRVVKLDENRTALLEESKKPLRLFDSPLYHFDLLVFPGDEIGFFFKYHHATVDALTVSLLNRRIQRTFQDLLEEKTSGTTEPPPSFSTFLNREQAYLESRRFREDETFWHREFEGFRPEIPDVGSTHSIATDRYEHTFSADLTDGITSFVAESETTVFRYFMALFFLYFAKRTGQDDIVIVTGHHNRITPRDKAMAGMTVSTVPIRSVLDQTQTFREFLDGVHQKVSSCLARQQYPFDFLAAHLREQGIDPQQVLGISVNHIPSFDGDFFVERYSPGADLALLDIKLNPNQRPRSDPLQICVDARRKVFDQASIEVLFRRLEGLVTRTLAAPETLLSDFEILSEEEKQEVLAFSHQSCQPDSGETPDSIFTLFDDAVRKFPDTPAVVDTQGQTSYRVLNESSRRLARRLAENGVTRGTRVAISMDRSRGFIIAALAVMRAGGAYIPINPNTPPQRAKSMLNDGEAAFLLSSSSQTFQGFDGEVLVPEWDEVEGEPEPGGSLPDVRGDDLAYIIYTSGTTGRPKGVMIEHRGLASFISWIADLWRLRQGDAAAANSTFMFDPSVAEIFAPLCRGATVHVLPTELRRSIHSLNQYFLDHHIDVATLTTRVGELFQAQIKKTSLRTLTVVGEQLTVFRKRDYELINAYGPTEATVYTTAHRVRQFEPTIPIGRPGPKVRAYVVDSQHHLVPIGEEGELLLAGPQVGRGYANRPELTEQAFRANRFSSSPDSSIAYKTGDRVRFRPDGLLEFLGRRDRQLKLRGFRVEPSEVEHTLRCHKAVEQCFVMKHPRPASTTLCAFYTTLGEDEVDEARLKPFLAERLPDYMVPETVLHVSELPLTPRGKTDSEALAKLLAAEDSTQPPATPPCTWTQARLLEIWKGALKSEHLGTRSDFFDSGGDSIQAMKVFAEIEETFNRRLPVSTIFEARTVEQLSERLATPQPASTIEPAVIHRGTSDRPLFCIHDITGDVMPYTNIARHLGERLTLLGIRYENDSSVGATTIEALATHYLEQVRATQPTGPYALMGYSIGGTIAFEMARQLVRNAQEVSFLGLIDTPNFVIYSNVFDSFRVATVRHVLAWIRSMPWTYKLLFLSSNFKRRLAKGSLLDLLGPQRDMKRMAARYRPAEYDGRVVLWKARQRLFAMDQHLGWGSVVSHLEVHNVDGNHVSLLDAGRSHQIAEELERLL